MNASETNLKFEYLYRDAGNYKQFGYVILKNPTQISPDAAKEMIQPYLIDSAFFLSEKVQVPQLEIYDFDPDMDHGWYEFERFSITGEDPTEECTTEDFLGRFE